MSAREVGAIVSSVVVFLITVFAILASWKFSRNNKNLPYEPPVKIRWTLDNALTVANIPLEFAQFFVFSLGLQAEWSR